MAHQGVATVGVAAVLATGVFAFAGCAAREPAPAPPVAAAPSAPVFADDETHLLRYRSRRLELVLPLPDGRAWRIDDHSQPEVVATHALTRSRVAVAVFGAGELVGRGRCEELARERGLVPGGDPRGLQTVEDVATITQETYDTRVTVAVRPDPAGPLAGHVLAFGGFLRKCYVFVYSTEVDRASDEPALSARLAFARTPILGGLKIEGLGMRLHDPESGPAVAPPR